MVGARLVRGDAVAKVASEAAKARMEKRMFDMSSSRLLLNMLLLMIREYLLCDGKVCLGESKERRKVGTNDHCYTYTQNTFPHP